MDFLPEVVVRRRAGQAFVDRCRARILDTVVGASA
jgi:hypothetical protein